MPKTDSAPSARLGRWRVLEKKDFAGFSKKTMQNREGFTGPGEKERNFHYQIGRGVRARNRCRDKGLHLTQPTGGEGVLREGEERGTVR